MGLSENAIRELRSELKAIEQNIAALQQRADAVRQILGERQQASLLDANVTAAQPSSFKAMVLTVVRENPGIKVPAVKAVLRERGWLPAGNTDLGHRVYNEMWRMTHTTRELRKTENGGYVAIDRP